MACWGSTAIKLDNYNKDFTLAILPVTFPSASARRNWSASAASDSPRRTCPPRSSPPARQSWFTVLRTRETSPIWRHITRRRSSPKRRSSSSRGQRCPRCRFFIAGCWNPSLPAARRHFRSYLKLNFLRVYFPSQTLHFFLRSPTDGVARIFLYKFPTTLFRDVRVRDETSLSWFEPTSASWPGTFEGCSTNWAIASRPNFWQFGLAGGRGSGFEDTK